MVLQFVIIILKMSAKKTIVLKIIILGDSGVGKTSLFQCYQKGKIQEQKPTVGVDFCKKEIKFIVSHIAPLLDIDMNEFKKNKKNIKINFEKLLAE